MSHQPKYTTVCQALINACQACACVTGAEVVVTQETASRMAMMKPSEFQLFNIQPHSKGAFTVTLKP